MPTAPTIATARRATRAKKAEPLHVKRIFTEAGVHPFDTVTWVQRDAVVGSGDRVVFEQRGVEFPDFWSGHAVNITASKYFRGKLGAPEREWSVKQMITRVTKVVRAWGERSGYFSAVHAEVFEQELAHMLVHQMGSFNSPVWFNVGTTEKPQCSACFILSVEDDMQSILSWIKNEGTIFKGGSGSGVNLSPLRSKHESLSQGGKASGPVSFMRGADSVAGMIKSGGTTRRAAKMVVLDIDHPDVVDFIQCKAQEEKKVRAFAEAGYNMANLNDEAWNSIQFQNANNSVRLTDEFMRAVESDGEWQTRYRTNGAVASTHRAREVLMQIAEAAWECGDPGVQFDTTINRWHTCPNAGRINASNPCSEYMHLDNSACNLASINVLKFLRDDGTFMVREFKHAVDVFILAQDIIVSHSSYPTKTIGENAEKFRQLGLGYANLGALLMAKGITYDSAEGAAWAGAISSLMAGEAYRFSTAIARRVGPFAGYAADREAMHRVVGMHQKATETVARELLGDRKLSEEVVRVWDEALEAGEQNGFRNSQVTVIAPTGTIALMMDCDTTGIEPDFSLVKMKQLVGGGWMRIVNASVPRALKQLGYIAQESRDIVEWVSTHGTVEGAPHIKDEHLSVFDCAVKPAEGTRTIPWQGHVRIVAAVQPFISGAISKTFNMSHETTKEEIFDAYRMAWNVGIKAFAVYRDGSKATQPLQTAHTKKTEKDTVPEIPRALRRRLPMTRPSETHKFSIAGHEGYLTYSMYEDGAPAEIFIKMAKQGSTLSGLLDSLAITVSMALQYGVPLKDLANKFIYSRFEPAGFTENPDIRIATSIVDYVFRYLVLRFVKLEDRELFGMDYVTTTATNAPLTEKEAIETQSSLNEVGKEAKRSVVADTVCRTCGGMMVRTGTCLTCTQCGSSSGGCS